MAADVLVDDGEPEPRALGAASPARGLASVEAVEDLLPLGWGDAGTLVRDRDHDGVAAGVSIHAHRGGASGVEGGVLDEVAEDPLEAALVHAQPQVGDLRRDLEAGGLSLGDLPEGAGERHRDQLGHVDLVEGQTSDLGVAAGDLEEIGDQALEATDVSGHQVEGLAAPLVELLAVGLEHVERGGERGQRGAELMADVRAEAGVSRGSAPRAGRPWH